MDAVALLSRRGSLVRGLTLLTLAALISTLGDRVIVPTVHAQSAPVGANFVLDAADLRFIFRQIQIAQIHSTNATVSAPCATLLQQIGEFRLPFGLRTIDGSCNHIEPDKTTFGAADQTFPRLATPTFRQAEQNTSYEQTDALDVVIDSQPRIISNLIADQTMNNPAAFAAAGGPFAEIVDENGNGIPEPALGETTFFIPNVAPDVGLSAPFNVMFTFFGQFFDHGLDLLNKGGNGAVMIPLQPDDPLITHGPDGLPGTGDEVPPGRRFMVLTRGTNLPGPDGQVGTDDDIHEGTNQTSPFVDQNQTYTSHPSHQVFLRQYVRADDPSTAVVDVRTRSTGRMIDGDTGGVSNGLVGNWGEVKRQAAQMLGIQLTDLDVFNVPLLFTDAYGYFERGPARQLPQLVLQGGGLLEGTLDNPATLANEATLIPAAALRTGHAFLDDIAHHANPFGDHDNNPATPNQALTVDADLIAGPDDGLPGTYDNELLERHFVTGDGRGNENIALTAVHTIFHSEHNRLRNQINTLINGPAGNGVGGLLTAAERTAWLAFDSASGWDYGERLFQAAKFVTEMQYQHLVFEEFARKLVPSINEFIGDGINFQSNTNPAIFAEFAHQTYRLGHSMLTETISRVSALGTVYDISLIDGFLNPLEFTRNADNPLVPLNASQAAGAIWRGGTRQVGNEIDEFVTEAVRNNLLGLPLDLPVLNLARGRDQGVPPFNEVRKQLFAASADFQLRPYESWIDFMFNMKHAESVVNFIAAYGTHPSVQTPTTLAAKRRAADILVNGPFVAPPLGAAEAVPADRDDFLFSTGAWANLPSGVSFRNITGVDVVDLWIGGLAERIAPFGGMLGTTFTYVFENQLENLQNADRFYYLERLDGLNLLAQLEGNSFTELIQRNTTLNGDAAAEVFARPDFVIDLSFQPLAGPLQDDPATLDFNEALELFRFPNGTIRYNGPAHVIWNGRDDLNSDRIFSSEGDDTLRGNGGNDVMEGGAGNDNHLGGAGDDILTDTFGEDVIKGGDGNDAISGGSGPFDLLQGNGGHDFIVAGNDVSETFGGSGNDIIYSGDGATEMFGGAGDDWIEGGPQLDLLVGDENNQFQDDPNQGHDVIAGGKGDDDYDSEGGDDVMIADVLGTERLEGMLGFDWVTYRGDPLPVDTDMNIRVVLPPNLDELRDRFDLAEALSGWNQSDILRGQDRVVNDLNGDTNQDGIPGDHALKAVGINLFNDPDVAGANSLRSFLDAFLGVGVSICPPTPGFETPRYCNGDIITGGLGSDLIEGRGGDDLIDGDVWLNAQLRAPNPAPLTGFRRVDSLHALKTDVFAGRLNPGNISIVRSIVNSGSTGLDVALFSGPIGNYTISNPNAAGVITVTDNVGLDGVDRLRNIEILRFPNGDGTFQEVGTGNLSPSGTPVLSQLLPQENEPLSVSTAGIVDPDGIVAGSFGFQWQVAPAGTSAFTNIAGATLQTFTPLQAQVGQIIRAVVLFTDGGGRRESVFSGPSGVVGDVFVGTTAVDVYNGTAGRDNADANAGNDVLIMGDAADVAIGNAGADNIDMGAGNDTASGGVGNDTINGGDGNDTLNGDGGLDTLNGGLGADTLNGGPDGDLLNGGDGNDALNGEAGTDTINGGAGADTISGGGENDVIRGDGGADNINGNTGNDDITGGAGNDILNGGGGANVFRFAPAFGADRVNGFDANAADGTQDLLNVSGIVGPGGAITAANFAANVTIAASGTTDTLITIRVPGTTTVAGTIVLNGVLPAAVNATDFSFVP